MSNFKSRYYIPTLYIYKHMSIILYKWYLYNTIPIFFKRKSIIDVFYIYVFIYILYVAILLYESVLYIYIYAAETFLKKLRV